MKKYVLLSGTILLLGLLVAACQDKPKPGYPPPAKKEKTEPAAEAPAPQKESPAVCVWDKGSLREKPVKKGKYVSAMALGEKVIWLNETAVDTADKNRTYHLIRLSDGTEGWASEYVVALNAKPGVAVGKAGIYSRPDMLTLTSKIFEKREMMAIVNEQGDWLEVVGNQKKKKGWVPAKSVSVSDANVAVALLAQKALAAKETAQKIEMLKFVLDKEEFSTSIFIADIKKELAELEVEAAAVE